MQHCLKVVGDDGRTLGGKAVLLFENWEFEEQQIDIEVGKDGELRFDDDDIQTARLAVIVPEQAGYWTGCVADFDQVETLICPTLQSVSSSWWHVLLGAELQNEHRGSEIQIGVVDGGFTPDASLAHIRILPALEDDFQSTSQRWEHGEAVCRILADRIVPECCTAISPGSSVVFASASYSVQTRESADFTSGLAGGVRPDQIDPRRVASAIYEMAFGLKVDIINLSLGCFEPSKENGGGVAEAIESALDAGVSFVCAAGNRFVNRAAFPASLPGCIGVGAVGMLGWGPEGTIVRHYADIYPHGGLGNLHGQDVYFWKYSAFGRGVDVLGPGVGIFIARNGKVSFEVSGTSFASPIVAGLLAVELSRDSTYHRLPRDRTRVNYALRRIRTLARKIGLDRRYEGAGMLTLASGGR
jgi:subtilisin family serine protease